MSLNLKENLLKLLSRERSLFMDNSNWLYQKAPEVSGLDIMTDFYLATKVFK